MQSSLIKLRPPQVENFVGKDVGKTQKKEEGSKISISPTGRAITTEDVLEYVLPPREWTENGQLWTQKVSSTPATRVDIVALRGELDKNLLQRQAKAYGICAIREDLYSQCFDEILRQVTVACAERGLLLHRIRGELQLLIRAYQKLHESSAAFGVRKALQAEQQKHDLNEKMKSLNRRNEQLVQEVNSLKRILEETGTSAIEKIEQEEKDYKAAMAIIRRKSQKLKHELERLLSATIWK